MSHIIPFNTWEEHDAITDHFEKAANARLTPEQIELRDDFEHHRYWAMPADGFLVFGSVPPEPTMTENRARGYLTNRAYSIVEPHGDPHDAHVYEVTPISEMAFAEAQNAAWKPPVSAVGAALPAWISVLLWLAATPEAIAIPIAPPSCWEVFKSPDASPAWCS